MCCQYVWSILSIEKKPCQQPLVESVFMDLSKAFYCISHDMLIEKFPVYGFRETTLKHIFTYLKNRRHCVYLNSTYGDFKDIISSDCFSKNKVITNTNKFESIVLQKNHVHIQPTYFKIQ